MSGRGVMAVRSCDELVAECDEGQSNVCLILVEALVRLAGGVIAGKKPAAIFNIPLRAYHRGSWHHLHRGLLDEVLRTYAQALVGYGMRLVVLYRSNRRVYLLAWRPMQLTEALSDPARLEILREEGYCGTTTDDLVNELRRRLVRYYLGGANEADAFPHEIGVFLGYPSEDVRGFMEGRMATCRGPWCAYGDERTARRRFEQLLASERKCRMRYAAGEPFHALFAS